MKPKVIILGSARNGNVIRVMEKYVAKNDFSVLSWLDHFGGVRSGSGFVPGENGKADEQKTLNLIAQADIVVALIPAGLTTAFEIGYAHARGKDVVLVGKEEQTRLEGVYLVVDKGKSYTAWAKGLEIALSNMIKTTFGFDVMEGRWFVAEPLVFYETQ